MVSKARMAVSLGGIQMRNPVNTASGTFGYGWQFEGMYDVARLGAITCKGVAAEPWPGNPAPRVAEVRSGILNSVGLQNPGAEAFCAEYGDYLSGLAERGCAVILQAVGHSVDECKAAVEALDSLAPWAAGFEVNVSCPNLSRGGKLLGGTPEDAAEVVRAVRPLTTRPLLVKLAPLDVSNIARACEDAGADALSLTNTVNAMSIDVHTRRSRLSRPTGGLSGPAIHPIAVRMVWEAAQAVSIPINGIGGIETWEDAAEMILAGATSVSVGTANMYDPASASRVVDGLAAWADEQGVSDINELIGAFEC
ncbi:MAG: dihydroorotate dehydrogenase [Tractidigestivibacter sp.]|jgi:dihydroorotate dehydrogenase (NAD+) catalytic subunit|uniref:dihydroorotate dehydrogenase n=1 Tax=Tractidigestivibacter sp. TaxID=2847320 RepID=UPI003D8ECF3C